MLMRPGAVVLLLPGLVLLLSGNGWGYRESLGTEGVKAADTESWFAQYSPPRRRFVYLRG